MRTLQRSVDRGEVRWSLAADIGSVCDNVDRTELKKRREVRGAEGSLLRRIGTGVHVGVLDGATRVEPEWGTAPGAVLSPL